MGAHLASLAAPARPWRVDEDGAVRITGTRVTLGTVIGAFRAGASPEEIVLQYPTLKLADVYSAIAYYLCHQAEIDTFLEEERRKASELRAEIEAAMPAGDVRARHLARQPSD
jgi:uncharacterized protein (DUF433 family)